MEITFYISAIIAVLTTLRVVTHHHPVHALLYLIVSLLAVAVIFFTLGAPFAAALEVIVYAGAIVVLFVFVVMMLGVDDDTITQERHWLAPRIWIGPSVVAAILLAALIGAMWGGDSTAAITGHTLGAKEVGLALFGPYMLMVELAGFLLLSALVAATHVARH